MDKLPDFSTILSAFISWQALVFGLVVVAVFHVIQNLIPDTVKERRYVKLSLLPALAILTGGACATVFPIHPDVLWQYVEEPTFTPEERRNILIGYGLVIGQLSGFLWLAVASALGKFAKPEPVPAPGPSPQPPPPSAPAP